VRLRKESGDWSMQDPSVGFYLLKKVQGRKLNRLLGDRQVLSVEEARRESQDLLKKLHKGVDPKDEQRKAAEVRELQGLTYRKALEGYLADADVTEGTRKKHRLSLTTTFRDVADKPLTYLTPERVRSIHKARSLQTRSRADQDMRVLRLVWNWARGQQKTKEGKAVLGDNPVGVLNKRERGPGQRGWNNVPRKETIIPRAKLPEWFQALHALRDADGITQARRVSALLLEALVLTGLRFNELAQLSWEDVDEDRNVLTIPDSSSKNRRALERPITRRVREILKQAGTTDGYVFPGRWTGKPLNDTRPLQVELQERTGLWITPHDLRRVYTSAASRAGLPAVVIKRLLNHMGHEDVTEGYIRVGLDELLDYSQTVEDTILGDAGLLVSRNLDNRLQDLLAGLPEDEKRRLLFDLAQRQLQEVG
jgi:integrase